MDDQKMFGLLEQLAADVFSRGLVGLADELVTADVELETPLISIHGLSDFKRYVSELRSKKKDFTASITAPEAIGRDIIATLTFSGTLVRDTAGVKAASQPFSVAGRISATVREGRIARLNVGYLLNEWLRQVQSDSSAAADVTNSYSIQQTSPTAAGSTTADLTEDEKLTLFRTMADTILVRGIHGAAVDLCTDDFVYESPLTHLVGVDVCNRYMRDIREAWQDIKLELSAEQVEGREVSADFSLNAIHSKVFYGVEATFKRFTLRGTIKGRIRGNKVSRVRVSYFLNEWLRQVGAEQQQ